MNREVTRLEVANVIVKALSLERRVENLFRNKMIGVGEYVQGVMVYDTSVPYQEQKDQYVMEFASKVDFKGEDEVYTLISKCLMADLGLAFPVAELKRCATGEQLMDFLQAR